MTSQYLLHKDWEGRTILLRSLCYKFSSLWPSYRALTQML